MLNNFIQVNNNKKIGGTQKTKKVVQYDLNGQLLNVYNSLSDAAKAVKGNSSNISKVCNKKQNTSYGYKWEFLEQ